MTGRANLLTRLQQKNKAVFYRLLTHKAAIEGAYGGALTRNRSDETRASQISDVQPEIDVGSENDWPKTARFPAIQTAKRLNAVQDYLQKSQKSLANMLLQGSFCRFFDNILRAGNRSDPKHGKPPPAPFLREKSRRGVPNCNV